jgi:hypothetical protein
MRNYQALYRLAIGLCQMLFDPPDVTQNLSNSGVGTLVSLELYHEHLRLSLMDR